MLLPKEKSGENIGASWAPRSTISCASYLRRTLIVPSVLTDYAGRYEAVWTATLRTYRDMVADEGWATRDQISVPVVQTLTFKVSSSLLKPVTPSQSPGLQVALLVISKCGFGFSFNWSEPVRTADGRMSLQEAFRVVSETVLITSFIPKWVRKLPFKRQAWLSCQCKG